uniref:Uncharacterized protein n=1 Tax=Eutreptiella gymnastica TaxID=73025 RepID=A0A7S1J0P2_9EUGL
MLLVYKYITIGLLRNPEIASGNRKWQSRGSVVDSLRRDSVLDSLPPVPYPYVCPARDTPLRADDQAYVLALQQPSVERKMRYSLADLDPFDSADSAALRSTKPKTEEGRRDLFLSASGAIPFHGDLQDSFALQRVLKNRQWHW